MLRLGQFEVFNQGVDLAPFVRFDLVPFVGLASRGVWTSAGFLVIEEYFNPTLFGAFNAGRLGGRKRDFHAFGCSLLHDVSEESSVHKDWLSSSFIEAVDKQSTAHQHAAGSEKREDKPVHGWHYDFAQNNVEKDIGIGDRSSVRHGGRGKEQDQGEICQEEQYAQQEQNNRDRV